MKSLYEIEREKCEAIEAACRPIRERIDAQYADRIAEAERYEAEGMARCFERQYEEALGNSLYPIGTEMVEWRQIGFVVGGRKIPTGRAGTWQIGKPDNPRWRGKAYILVNLKNGKPGKKMADPWGWYPKGVDPNES